MCDCLLALGPATASDRAIWAKNSDRPPNEPQRLEWLAPRRDMAPLPVTHIEVEPHPGQTLGVIGSRPWWMRGLEHGVNEAGVAAGNETIYTTDDPRHAPPGLTGMDLVRLALERATSAAGAVEIMVELLERYGQGGSGHYGVERPYWSSFLLADAGDGWVLETSGRRWAAEQVRRSRAISNRTTIPAFDAEHRHPRQPVETLVDPRLRASEAVLAREPITVDAVKRHLRSHAGGDDGWTVCMHVEGVEATTASLIVELGGSQPLVRALAGSPCRSLYVPLVVGRALGDPVSWERLTAVPPHAAAPGGPLRVLEDALEAEAACGAADTDGWAPAAWSRLGAVLDDLGVAPA